MKIYIFHNERKKGEKKGKKKQTVSVKAKINETKKRVRELGMWEWRD